MTILETLKKEFFEIQFNKYSKTMDIRGATIAATFALEDEINMFKQHSRNISEEYALEAFKAEIDFSKEMNNK